MGAERAIAEVLNASGAPVGLGFAIDGPSIVTCAHVVNAALGREPRDTSAPDEASVALRFPFATGQPSLTADVCRWAPDPVGDFDEADFAGLVAQEPLPDDVELAVLASADELAGRPRVNVYGPVSARPDGGIVPATILGLLPNGRVQLNQEVVGTFRAARGFSGGPAWLVDEPGHVAGMIVAVGRPEEARDVYLLGVDRLAALWPEQLHRATAASRLERVFLRTLLDAPDLATLFVPPVGSVPLDRVFVAPFIIPYGAADAIAWDACEEETAQDAVARFDRMVVIAGPGMGKSTFLRFLTRQLAAGAMPRTYPILVSLGAYVAHHGQRDLLSFALHDRYGDVLKREELERLDDAVRAWNGEGRLLFLLDGLDEVAEDRRRLLLNEIVRLKRFVATSRPLARIPLNQEQGATLQLCPLGGASIARFVRNWEAAGLSGDGFSAERLLDRLRADAGLGDLARTPQLLGLICWLVGSGPGDVSLTRTELLARAVSGLIQSAVERSGVAPEEAERLSLRLRGWLRQLAFDRLESTDEASARFSREEFVEGAERFAGSEEAFKLTRLAHWSGLIVPAPGSDDDLQFLHLAFQEFLAAEALVRSTDLAAAVDRVKHQSDCEESLRMACAILNGTNGDDQLRVILERLLADSDIFRLNWHLAARCLSEVSDADRRLGSVVARLARTLLEGASEWWARDAYARAIGEVRTPSTREILVSALDDQDRQVRWAAAEGLAAMADPASVDVILDAITDESWSPVRASLVSALGRIADPRALSTLGALAETPTDSRMQHAIGVALGRLDAIETLEGLLDCDDDVIDNVVVYSLPYLREESAERLRSRLARLGVTVRFAPDNPFASAGPSLAEVDALLASSNVDDRLAAVKALEVRADWAALLRLIDLLLEEDVSLSSAAARALTEMGDDHVALVEAVRLLIRTMLDPGSEERDAAAAALVELWLSEDARAAVDESARSVFDELLDVSDLDALAALIDADDAAGRAAACWVLAYFSEAPGEALLRAVGDETDVVRWIAAWSVGRRRDSSVIPVLLQRLGDEVVVEICAAIVTSLGMLRASYAAPALVELLGSEEDGIRLAAADALGLLEDPTVAQDLIASLEDATAEVRCAAVEALDRLRAVEAGAALVTRLEQDDDPSVVIATIVALADLDHQDATSALVRRLDDDVEGIRIAALEALGRIGGAAVGSRLIEQLERETSRGGITEAAVAIGKVAEASLVLAVAEHLVGGNELSPLASLTQGVAQRGDPHLVTALIDLLRARDVTAIVARHAVEVQRGDETNSHIVTPPDDVDAESPNWIDRWEAVMVWSSIADESAVRALAARLRDDEPRVVRAAASSLESAYHEGPLADLVWDAIGVETQEALADGTFDEMVTRLLAEAGPSEHWVLARLELLCKLLAAYLGGRQELRPVLWEIGERYGLRMLDDGRVITAAGEVLACDDAVARLTSAMR